MSIARVVALIGLVAMTAVLVYGFAVGDLLGDRAAGEGGRLLAMPWGIVSLVDLYVGFALFSVWIVYREASWWRSVIWVALMVTLGFWAGSLYALLALGRCDGDWRRFWLGRRA
ncbi:MAG: DUF1475 family protein [Chloroflexota bacterium]